MRLSYSKLLTYRTCPKKYEFKYIQRLPEQETEELIIGKLGHLILENYYKLEQRSQEAMNDLIKLHSPAELVDRMLEALDGYHKWANEEAVPRDSELNGLSPEVSLETNLSPRDTYEGRIDATFESNGINAILEHKFKKNWSIDYVKNLEFDEQPVSYSLLAGINAVYYNLIRTVPAKTRPKFERIQVIVPNSEADRLVKDAMIWKSRIELDTDLKEFARNRGFHCQWCAYKPQCFNYEEPNE